MPYVGGTLAPLFGQRPSKRAMRNLADKGGEVMTERTAQNTPVESGRLRRSWKKKHVVIGVDMNGNVVYRSGTYTRVKYAPYVEHGTGLWGPKHAKYAIYPRTPGGVLAFQPRTGGLHPVTGSPLTGDTIFVRKVMHPGSPGQHMLAIGGALAEAELRAFAKPILEAWARDQAADGKARQRA